MKARLFKVENRLAAVVARPGGRSIAETIQRADRRVHKLHQELRGGVPAKAAQLVTLLGAAESDPAGTLDRLYEAANQLFAIAAAVGLEPLAAAAYGLCDLVEAFRAGGGANWKVITLYVDGVRTLSLQPDGGASGAAVVKELRKLGAHYANRVRVAD